jgi:hypothetical protein
MNQIFGQDYTAVKILRIHTEWVFNPVNPFIRVILPALSLSKCSTSLWAPWRRYALGLFCAYQILTSRQFS